MMRRWSRWCGLALVLGPLGAGPASALSVGGVEVDPLYFAGPGMWGLDRDAAATYATLDTRDFAFWSTLGEGFVVDRGLPVVLNGAPFVAESLWTVTNTSDSTLHDFQLLVLRVAFGDPADGVGLDVGLPGVAVAEHSGCGSTCYFAVISIGDLAPNETSAPFLVRTVLDGGLPLDPESGVLLESLPALSVIGVAVPEPATLAMLALGIGALAAASRTRRR